MYSILNSRVYFVSNLFYFIRNSNLSILETAKTLKQSFSWNEHQKRQKHSNYCHSVFLKATEKKLHNQLSTVVYMLKTTRYREQNLSEVLKTL